MSHHTAQYIELGRAKDTAYSTYYAWYCDVWHAVLQGMLCNTADAMRYYVPFAIRFVVLLPMRCGTYFGTAQRKAKDIASAVLVQFLLLPLSLARSVPGTALALSARIVPGMDLAGDARIVPGMDLAGASKNRASIELRRTEDTAYSTWYAWHGDIASAVLAHFLLLPWYVARAVPGMVLALSARIVPTSLAQILHSLQEACLAQILHSLQSACQAWLLHICKRRANTAERTASE